MTPMTLLSKRIGALMILWISSCVSPLSFMFSKTLAWRAALNLLSISGRLSRKVFAARAELLDNGMKPTFFSASGTIKCKCFHFEDTPQYCHFLLSNSHGPRNFLCNGKKGRLDTACAFRFECS